MAELLQANWIYLVAALVLGIIVAWWIFVANRKTKVEIEPKEEGDGTAKRNQALIDAPPAASAPPPPPVTAAQREAAPVPAASAASDDLTRIKGLGPKLKTQLGEMGITSFAQIAAWDDTEIDRVDARLGRFQGRIRRDNWVEQAKHLAAGDQAGFEDKFGRT